MVALDGPDLEESKDESSESTQLVVEKRRRKKATVKEGEMTPSRVKELEKLATEAERESKARKMVEVSEASARWLEIREALHKEKEHRSEMKRRIEMEEMNNPKVSLPPPPPPPVRKRRKSVKGGASANVGTGAMLAVSSSIGSGQSNQSPNLQQPLQITSEATLGQLFPLSTQTSQVTWPKDDDPPRTLQLFPEAPTPDDPQHNVIAAIHHGASSAKRVAVAIAVSRINGEMLIGTLNRFQSFNELVVCCDCHNRMFTPEGFLNHAGWTLQWGDDPLKYIVMLN